MLFQTLDDKNECVAYYQDGELLNELLPSMTHTWATPTYLKGKDIEYAYLYAQSSLKDACPDYLKKELSECSDLLMAYMRSMTQAKLDMDQHCFYDLVPDQFLIRFCEIKNKISKHVFDNCPKPSDYEFLSDLHQICQEISFRKLNLDFSSVLRDTTDFASRNKLKSVRAAAPYVRYDIFGSRTGRLTTKPNSFPILNLKKQFRQAIKPTNDLFVELDYNAFELRVMLFLMGRPQPNIDIHEWNVSNVYRGVPTRDEAKTKIFAWLYNLDSNDRLPEKVYNRQEIINKYWDGAKVVNPFGRSIESDKFHAISYLIQSTAVDIVLRQMIEIDKLLKDKKSFIAFTVHDSVVIDMASEDFKMLSEIKNKFSTYGGTQFLVNVSAGHDFGNMRDIE